MRGDEEKMMVSNIRCHKIDCVFQHIPHIDTPSINININSYTSSNASYDWRISSYVGVFLRGVSHTGNVYSRG